MRSPCISAAVVMILAGATGCVETSVYEKTAGQLDAATRASAQKDQQIRALEWQLITLTQQLREAEARGEARAREASAQAAKLSAENAALTERVKAAEEARDRANQLATQGDTTNKGGRARPDEAHRIAAALGEQQARLLERIARLEQKIDAHAAEERARNKARPERSVDGDVVDPWGFGTRK